MAASVPEDYKNGYSGLQVKKNYQQNYGNYKNSFYGSRELHPHGPDGAVDYKHGCSKLRQHAAGEQGKD